MLIAMLGSIAALGFLGSLHCAVMCGPLAVAAQSERARGGGLRYFAGRFAGHVAVGALLGFLGLRASELGSRAGFQAAVSLTLAALLFVRGIRLLRPARPPGVVPLRRKRPLRIAELVGPLMPRRGLSLGLATSVLPCGLLAAAWALAASLGTPARSALAMAVFSIASAPGLLAAVLAGAPLARLQSRFSARAQGFAWCAFALVLAVRPAFATVHACCH